MRPLFLILQGRSLEHMVMQTQTDPESEEIDQEAFRNHSISKFIVALHSVLSIMTAS